eukprot:6111573-Prymnesium_polylepis.1
MGLTFSTADNTKPLQLAPAHVTEVRLGVLLPMFGTASADYSLLSWSPRVGVYQALREVNNKTDGVVDHLLPSTQLKFAYRDSKCDATSTLAGALHLTRDSFDGEAVSAVIGAGCSDASRMAAQVASTSSVPTVSPSATSPLLSDGRAVPYLLRLAPSDIKAAECIVDVLQHLLGYSSVALASSSDPFGVGGAQAFDDAAGVAGVTVSVSVSFQKDAADFTLQHQRLIRSAARVIVLVCQDNDGVHFIRAALQAGIGGA